MNTLVLRNQVPGFYSYTKPVKEKEKFQLVQIEQLEEAIFAPLVIDKASGNHYISYKSKFKSDLPVASDFGEIHSPYQLIYARLEGLQYRPINTI